MALVWRLHRCRDCNPSPVFLGLSEPRQLCPALRKTRPAAEILLCVLGTPLAIGLGTWAWIAGLGLSLIFLFLSGAALLQPGSGRGWRAACAFTAIGCFAGLAGAATALGRIGLRLEWALSSRYVTFSIYLPIAVIGLSALHFSRSDDPGAPPGRRRRKLATALIVLGILASSLGTYHRGMRGMMWTKRNRSRGRAALLFSEILPNNPDLKILHPDPELVIRRYQELLHCGMAQAPFLPPGSVPKFEPRAGVGRSNGSFEFCQLKDHQLWMKGWALGARERAAPFVLFAARSNGTEATLFSVAPTGNPSPKHAPRGVRNCGFELKIDQPDLPEGPVEISAWAFDPQRKTVAQLELVHEVQLPRVDQAPR